MMKEHVVNKTPGSDDTKYSDIKSVDNHGHDLSDTNNEEASKQDKVHNEVLDSNMEYDNPFECNVLTHEGNKNNNVVSKNDVHEEKKPFKCDICCQKFSIQHSLKRHLAGVHEVEKGKVTVFSCEHCNYVTVVEKNLDTHIKSAKKFSPEKFRCDFCMKLFCTKTSRRFHTKKEHADRNKSSESEVINESLDSKAIKDNDEIQNFEKYGLFDEPSQEDKVTELEKFMKLNENVVEVTFRCMSCPYSTSIDGEMIRHHISAHSVSVVPDLS